MKYNVGKLILLLLLFSLHAYAQENSVWFPTQYIETLKLENISRNELLIPVAAIEFNNNELLINFFRGEVNPVIYKKIVAYGVSKFELPNLKEHVNLKYFSRDYAEQIANTKFFIILKNDSLILEIVYDGITKEISYTNHLDEYIFKNIYDSMQYFKTKL